MQAPQLQRKLLNLSDYHKMIEVGILTQSDKVELINGEILHMSPIGTKHTATVNRINKLFSSSFPELIVQVQGPVQIPPNSEPEPDVILLRPKANFYEDALPMPNDVYLVVEVADSSLEFDQEVKLKLYAKAGITEYWIANIPKKQLEIYRDPFQDSYRHRTLAFIGESVSCLQFPDKLIDVKDIFGS